MSKVISSDYDPVSGMTTEYIDNGNGTVTVRKLQDVEPGLIRNAQEMRAQSSKSRFGMKEGMGRKVASIPMGVVEKLAMEGKNVLAFNEKQMKAFLNDPEFSKLRTAYGRL